ncbi:MAG: hypothetical protein F7C35_06225 [Desulfurococcales archaeon]|nr:hypothetical protein [Desulfurococcales archaeon]
MRRRVRKGLSEVLGALIMVIMFTGMIALLYHASEEANKRITEAYATAGRALQEASNPPVVKVSTRDGSVTALITAIVPTRIEALVVEFDNHSVREPLGRGLDLAPGQQAEIPLFREQWCRPFKIVLVLEGGTSLYYPRDKPYYSCLSPSSGYSWNPISGGTMLTLAPSGLPGFEGPLYAYTFNLSITGALSEGGLKGEKGIIRITLDNGDKRFITREGEDALIALLAGGHLAFEAEVESVNNVSVLLLKFSPLDSQGLLLPLIRLNASLHYYTILPYGSVVDDVCEHASTTLMPYPYAPLVLYSNVSGHCDLVYGYYKMSIKGRFTANATLAGPVASLLVSTQAEPLPFTLDLSLEVELYRPVNPPVNTSLEIQPPAALEMNLTGPRPHMTAPPEHSVAITVHDMVDPRIAVVRLKDLSGTVIGGQTMIPSLARHPYRVPGVSNSTIQLEITYAPLLPPSNMSLLIINITPEPNNIYNYTSRLEETSYPAHWAFPAILEINSRVGGATVILSSTPQPPLNGKGFLDVLLFSDTIQPGGSGVWAIPSCGTIQGYFYIKNQANIHNIEGVRSASQLIEAIQTGERVVYVFTIYGRTQILGEELDVVSGGIYMLP